MTPHEIFSRTISESAVAGNFDRNTLVSQACDLTRDLRNHGSTPESALKSVKAAMRNATLDPPNKLQEEIVTNCIVTFFEG